MDLVEVIHHLDKVDPLISQDILLNLDTPKHSLDTLLPNQGTLHSLETQDSLDTLHRLEIQVSLLILHNLDILRNLDILHNLDTLRNQDIQPSLDTLPRIKAYLQTQLLQQALVWSVDLLGPKFKGKSLQSQLKIKDLLKV